MLYKSHEKDILTLYHRNPELLSEMKKRMRQGWVAHHVSYRKNITVPLPRKQHFLRHFGFGKCFLCGKKDKNRRCFAPVNPKTGAGYYETFVNPRTGNINHPWPRRGRWILLCEKCKPEAIGVRISSEGMR